MGCKTETKNIDDVDYSVTQWPATKALTNKFKIGKVLGPALSVISLDIKDDKSVESLGKGISAIFEHSDPHEVVELIKSCIINNVSKDKKLLTSSDFETLFSGDDLILVYKLFIFVLKVNYGNLFKGQWAKGLLAKMEK